MNMYFKISDNESIDKIDKSLACIDEFDNKLKQLQDKYNADKPYVFNSLDRGIEFSNLWFEKYPMHLDCEKEFKISSEKYKTGWEVRPRKSNKKFYNEFMKGMNYASYKDLKIVLFGREDIRTSLEYTKIDESYYIMSSVKLSIDHKEITASQYIDSIK